MCQCRVCECDSWKKSCVIGVQCAFSTVFDLAGTYFCVCVCVPAYSLKVITRWHIAVLNWFSVDGLGGCERPVSAALPGMDITWTHWSLDGFWPGTCRESNRKKADWLNIGLNNKPLFPWLYTVRMADPSDRVSSARRLLGLRFRIPPEAWMSVSFECCVLSSSGLCDRLITRPGSPAEFGVSWVWSWALTMMSPCSTVTVESC
jgi:hypothetical protein